MKTAVTQCVSGTLVGRSITTNTYDQLLVERARAVAVPYRPQ